MELRKNICPASDPAIVLAIIALASKLLVSANLLIYVGVPYALEGGMIIAKIHPGTYIAAVAFLLRLAQFAGRPDLLFRSLWQTCDLTLYILAILACLVCAAVLTGQGGLVTLIDTFLPAGMTGFVLAGASHAQLTALRRTLRLLFLMNAILALGEACAGADLIPMAGNLAVVPTHDAASLAEFRPTALYDHPLTGAAATMLGLLLRDGGGRFRLAAICYDIILFAALLAFGGRVALVMFILGATGLYAVHVTRQVVRLRAGWRDVLPGILAPAVAVPLGAVAFYSGLAGRLMQHSYWDASAQSRIDLFLILRRFTLQQILLGCRRDDFLALVEPLRLSYGLAAVENFWVMIFATLGALCFPVFLLGMAALVRFLWQAGDARARVMVITLLGVASTSNSLGRKSILLMVLTGCVAASGGGWRLAGVHMRQRPYCDGAAVHA